jgi:hypothetical protein
MPTVRTLALMLAALLLALPSRADVPPNTPYVESTNPDHPRGALRRARREAARGDLAAHSEDGHIIDVDPVNTEVVTADVDNSPNWFDAIGDVLVAKGSSFDEAYQDFAIWRLLTGLWDDGHHFQDAAKYPLPAFTATVDPATLPIKVVHPTKLVARYGTSYVRVDSSKLAAGKAIKLSVTGLAAPMRCASRSASGT